MCKNDILKTKRSSSSSSSAIAATTTVSGNGGSISAMLTLNHNNNDDRNDTTSQHQRGLSPLSISSSSSGSSTSSTSSSSNDDVNDRRNKAAADDTDDIDNIDLIPVQQDHIDSNTNNNKGFGLVRLRHRTSTTNNTMRTNNDTLSSSSYDSTTTKRTSTTKPSNTTFYMKCIEHIPWCISAVITAIVMTWFSLVLPFTLAPDAAIKTYVLAQWEYNNILSSFDNTIYTYGTDYFLAFCMMLIILNIPYNTNSLFDTTAYYTNGLLGSYMISVIAGGIAHQFFTSIELQNTMYFRIVWIICVGAVAIASAFMGSAASSLLQVHTTLLSSSSLSNKKDNIKNSEEKQHSSWFNSLKLISVPIIPVSFWIVYAICVTFVVIVGRFSFQRPACDIFVVGITQFPSTCYMMLVLYCFGNTNNTNHSSNMETTTITSKPSQHYHHQQQVNVVLCNRMRIISCIGFILNAPLLPMYPILVQYTNFTLGTINTLLHTWLLIAWSCQGLSIRHIGLLIVQSEKQKQQKQEQIFNIKNNISSSSSKTNLKIID